MSTDMRLLGVDLRDVRGQSEMEGHMTVNPAVSGTQP